MGPQPDELEFVADLAVDQDEIWPDMTIPVVFPRARERMVAVTSFQRLVQNQTGHDGA